MDLRSTSFPIRSLRCITFLNIGSHIPAESIDLRLASEHLLIAIEISSDEFWGMTAEASEICDTTDELYSEVEAALKGS